MVTYKDFIDVKRNKLSLLTQPYELLNMKVKKNLQSIFRRFQTILNNFVYSSYIKINMITLIKFYTV